MLEIKDRDILKFLDGSSSKKGREAMRTWAYESVENAQDLAFTQKVYKESDKLSEYNPVDVNDEWTLFLSQSTISSVTDEGQKEEIIIDHDINETFDIVEETSDLEILSFLDGSLTKKEQNKIQAWSNSDSVNKEVLELNSLILSESAQMGSFRSVDANAEWSSFMSVIKDKEVKDNVISMTPVTQTTTSTYVVKEEERSSSIIPLWMRLAAAAAVAFLLGAFFWNSSGNIFGSSLENNYASYQTQLNTHKFDMIDGSRISLGENTNIRYPKSIEDIDERKLFVEGEAEFDVATNDEKPFVVEVSSEIGVVVLGTIFKVFAHEDFVEAVENIEGKVRAYSLKNPDIYVELGPGDKYGWDGTTFVDLNITEIIDNSTEYNILYVLDYLMANSSWKVISSSNMPFDEEGMVKVDLNMPLVDILEDLRQRADFEFVEMNCENCYRITKFKQFSE